MTNRKRRMTPAEWREVRTVLQAAREQPSEERSALVDRLCGERSWLRSEVESLLAAEAAAGSFLESHAFDLGAADPDSVHSGEARYRILERIGSGGMGVVYRAERSDGVFQKEVALKVLQQGLESDELVRRFEGERQILAQLEHPSVARLLDGGTLADGRPFLVMEHVEGAPIDRYCADRKLDLAARLELFCKVCDAVRFAHRNLVIHRDLKPANILVDDDGEPKLLDFGIAKLLGPAAGLAPATLTREGAGPMTARYASPEQIEGSPLSTASDVYALGVVLFELLTGGHPLGLATGADPVSAARAILEGEPRALSDAASRAPETAGLPVEAGRWSRQLRGDLDTIVAMALRRRPERRYASAEELSGDVRRFLDGLPVSARPDSALYVASRFVRRHRASVAGAVTVFLLLIVSTVLLYQQQRRVGRQRDRAERVSDFLLELLEQPDPTRARGETITVREVLGSGLRLIEGELEGEPALQAELLVTLGRVHANLGLYDEAVQILETALARQRQARSSPAEVAATLYWRAEALRQRGDSAESEVAAREAVGILEEHGGPDSLPLALARAGLANVVERRGRLQEAEAIYHQAIAEARSADVAEPLVEALVGLGSLQRQLGRYEEARTLVGEALAVAIAAYGERHPDVATTLNDLALIEKHTDPDAAEATLRRAEGIQRRLFDEPHSSLATTLSNLGLLLAEGGRLAEADPVYLETLEIFRTVYGGDHPKVAATLNNLALLRRDQGRLEEAETLQLEALAMQRRTAGEGHPDTGIQLDNLGHLLLLQGRLDEAEAFFEEALGIHRLHLEEPHRQIAASLANLAEIARRRGDGEAATRLLGESIAMLRGSLGDDHPELAFALYNRATMEEALERRGAAAESFDEALAILLSTYGEDHPYVPLIRGNLASVRRALGECVAARALAERALEGLESQGPSAEPWRVAMRDVLRGCPEAAPEEGGSAGATPP